MINAETVNSLKWLTDYIRAIEKADTSCEQKLILPELREVRNLLSMYVGTPEKLPNNMRCCRCGLPKEPGVIICKCCGGTTYEGYYDKSRQESKVSEEES